MREIIPTVTQLYTMTCGKPDGSCNTLHDLKLKSARAMLLILERKGYSTFIIQPEAEPIPNALLVPNSQPPAEGAA